MKNVKLLACICALLCLTWGYTAKAQYEFPTCYPEYDQAQAPYNAGETVSKNGINYQCAYYVNTPPPSQGWTMVGPCGDGGLGSDYEGPQRVIGYLPYWVPDYDLVNDFDPSVVTHLNIAFNLFKQNNNDFNSSDFASIDWADFHKRKVDSLLFDLDILNRAHQAGVTVSVAVGGATDFAFIWLMEQYYQNDAKLEEIADLIVNYVNTTGIDGVDLDMECWWPDPAINGTVEKGGRVRGDKWGGSDQGPEPAAIGLTKLAQKLRQKMPEKLLSAAVFGTSWYGNNYDDGLAEHLDWLGLMTYDFTGSWDKSPKGPHSALYKVPQGYPGQSVDNPIYSAQDALEYWMGLAEPAWNHDGGFDVPKAKLALGVPLYGYDFSTEKPNNGNGYVAVPYRKIIEDYPNAATSFDPLDSHNLGGKVDQIYYNTPAGGAAKIKYSSDYGHQGVIIWELTQDVPFNNNSSILKAINDELGNNVGIAPTVNITSPANNSTFNEGVTVPITATATDTDGTVTQVEFFIDNTSIGTVTSATDMYTINWNNSTPGTHELKAVATDNDNKKGTSQVVIIEINYVPVLTTIEVSPATATIALNETQQFTAKAFDQTGAEMNTTFSWTVTGGTINTTGLFTGNEEGDFTVTATSGSKSASAGISVTNETPVLTTIVVTPVNATINEGEILQFSAQGYDQFNNTMNVTLVWSTTSNTIDANGLYTGTTTGSSTVTATSGTISGTANITVTEVGDCDAPQYVAGTTYATGTHVSNNNIEYNCKVGGWCSSEAAWAYAPGMGAHWQDAWEEVGPCIGGDKILTSVEVTPSNVTVSLNATQQFVAQGYDQHGNPMNTSFTWNATGGTISANGLFSATEEGSFTVTATAGTLFDDANVSVITGGGCTAPAWVSTETYNGGNIVSHNNHEWKAKWWTTNEEPGTTGQWGVWEDLGACGTLKDAQFQNEFIIVNSFKIYPNPFSNTLLFNIGLTSNCNVTLEVYNELGKRVKTLVNKNLGKGNHALQFNEVNFPQGIYFYRLKTNNTYRFGKLIKE